MFLRRGDHEMALGHEDFLRGLDEFERALSRDQRRSLENDVFKVSLGRAMLFISQVAFLTVSLQVAVFIVQSWGGQQVRLREKDLAIVDLQKKLEESSAERREADEKLLKLQAYLDEKLSLFKVRKHN